MTNDYSIYYIKDFYTAHRINKQGNIVYRNAIDLLQNTTNMQPYGIKKEIRFAASDFKHSLRAGMSRCATYYKKLPQEEHLNVAEVMKTLDNLIKLIPTEYIKNVNYQNFKDYIDGIINYLNEKNGTIKEYDMPEQKLDLIKKTIISQLYQTRYMD